MESTISQNFRPVNAPDTLYVSKVNKSNIEEGTQTSTPSSHNDDIPIAVVVHEILYVK
jgi:hypothetical protein